MFRFLLWRALGLLAVLVTFALTGWLLNGGLGAALRGIRSTGHRAAGRNDA